MPQVKSYYRFENLDVESALEYLYTIHAKWTDFIDIDSVPAKELKLQSALWELVKTEAVYIHTLKLITDVSAFEERKN